MAQRQSHFEAAAALIKNEDTRDIVQFQYGCAWRSKEVAGLEWSKVDLTDWASAYRARTPRIKSRGP
jgi:hypothetical protein